MFSKFNGILKGHYKKLVIILSMACFARLVTTIIDPLIQKLLIDEGLMKQDLELMIFVLILILFLAIGLRFLHLWQCLLTKKLTNSITKMSTFRMLKSYFQRDYEEVSKKDKGYFLARIYEEPAKASELSVSIILGTAVNFIGLLTATCVCVYLSWKLSLILAFITPMLFMLAKHFGSKVKKISKIESEEKANFQASLLRGIGAFKINRIFDFEDIICDKTIHDLDYYLLQTYLKSKTSQLYHCLSRVFLSLVESTVMILAGFAVIYSELTIGEYFAYTIGFWKIMPAVTGLASQVPKFSTFSAIMDRISEFEYYQVCPAISPENKKIEIKNISYSYGDKEIFQGFSCSVHKGDRILLLGSNGSGKSTLAHILSGLLEPKGSFVSIRKQDVSAQLAPATFFKGTLNEHLEALLRDTEKKKLAKDLLRDFGLQNKLDKDPDTFSEGEKQKTMIAMTLLKDSKLYIFDEPLNAIDEVTKPKIMEWILRITREKILFVIMHGEEKYYKNFSKTYSLYSPSGQKIQTPDITRFCGE